MSDAMGKDPKNYTNNEREAIRRANSELINRFGTATMRWGGARSYLWLNVYFKNLDQLEASTSQ